MGEPVLVLDGVWKGFGRGGHWVSVLEDASLTVWAGEVTSVVGTRDEGKTTLVNIAAGIERPERGLVRVAGIEMVGLSGKGLSKVLREQIGVAGRDGPATPQRMSEYVGVRVANGQRFAPRKRRMLVREVLERLDVADCATSWWEELSRWQRVRVELAQAIVTRPRLLLVDDVLDGLGIGKTEAAMELVRDLAAEVNCGVLMVASDIMAADPSHYVWRLAGKKLRQIADNTTGQNVHPIGQPGRADEASA